MKTIDDVFLRLIQINRPIAQKEARLDKPLIVSMTSYGHRLKTCHLSVSCVLSQTILPTKILLWLSKEDSAMAPGNLLSLKSSRFEIRVTEDIRSYKKLIPTLINFPDSYIVTLDDDWYFPPTWLEELINAHDFSRLDVTSHRVHIISRSADGKVRPYKEWKRTAGIKLDPSPDIFPTNGAGTLFPPGALHPNVLIKDDFLQQAPTSDDIWIYSMLRKAGNMCRSTGSYDREFNWPGTQVQSLWSINSRGANDEACSRLFDQE